MKRITRLKGNKEPIPPKDIDEALTEQAIFKEHEYADQVAVSKTVTNGQRQVSTGQKLRGLRKAKKLSGRRFAKMVGINPDTLSIIERGKLTKRPQMKH